jgi:hypothetical protein
MTTYVVQGELGGKGLVVGIRWTPLTGVLPNFFLPLELDLALATAVKLVSLTSRQSALDASKLVVRIT